MNNFKRLLASALVACSCACAEMAIVDAKAQKAESNRFFFIVLSVLSWFISYAVCTQSSSRGYYPNKMDTLSGSGRDISSYRTACQRDSRRDTSP